MQKVLSPSCEEKYMTVSINKTNDRYSLKMTEIRSWPDWWSGIS